MRYVKIDTSDGETRWINLARIAQRFKFTRRIWMPWLRTSTRHKQASETRLVRKHHAQRGDCVIHLRPFKQGQDVTFGTRRNSRVQAYATPPSYRCSCRRERLMISRSLNKE